MAVRDRLDALDYMFQNDIDPQAGKVGVAFDSNYYCIVTDISQKYTLGGFIKPDYNNDKRVTFKFGVAGTVTTGSSDPNSPLNTWVKEQLMYIDTQVSIQPNRNNGFNFWFKGFSQDFSDDDTDQMFDRIWRWTSLNTIPQYQKTLMDIERGIYKDEKETVKRVALTDKAKAYLGIKSLIALDGEILTLLGVTRGFTKRFWAYAIVQDTNGSLFDRKGVMAVLTDGKKDYDAGMFNEPDQAAYAKLQSFDKEYCLMVND